LAVVIPAFNAARYLERAVNSVFATRYPCIEVVIVDDGSTDATLDVARRVADRWPGQCTVLRHPNGNRRGVSASRNLGIESTRSEWLAFLDADDEYLRHRFEDFLTALAGREGFDAIYGMAEVRIEAGGVGPTPTTTDRFGISEALSGTPLLAHLLEGRAWAISAITLSRAVLHRTGDFETERKIAEDCHLWFRLAAIGFVIPGNLDRPISIYWRHGANTYTYRVEHRLPMLDAMLDVWEWIRNQGGRQPMEATIAHGVREYALRSLIAAKEVGERQTSLALIRCLYARRIALLVYLPIARQAWSVLKASARRQPKVRTQSKPRHRA